MITPISSVPPINDRQALQPPTQKPDHAHTQVPVTLKSGELLSDQVTLKNAG